MNNLPEEELVPIVDLSSPDFHPGKVERLMTLDILVALSVSQADLEEKVPDKEDQKREVGLEIGWIQIFLLSLTCNMLPQLH